MRRRSERPLKEVYDRTEMILEAEGPVDDSDIEFGRINSISSGDKQPEKLIKKVFVRKKKNLAVGSRPASVQTEATSSTQPAHLSQSSPLLPPRASSSHRLPSPDATHSTPFYLLFPSLPPGVPLTYPYSPYILPYYPPPPPHPTTVGPSTPITAEQAGQQAEQTRQVGQSAQATDGRMLIEPDGDTFYPSKQPTHKIRDIIRSRYDAPYISWKKVPKEVRDMWFREIEKDFYWLPQHNDRIRKNFEKRGSARMRDMFTDIRKSDERPLWIEESVWAELNAAWGSPKYSRRRDLNRHIRASNVRGMGSSLHTGGSIPHTGHRRYLKAMLDRESTLIELHSHTHKRQEDQQWVDEWARKAYEDYTRLRDSQPAAGEGSSAGTAEHLEYRIWSQAVGEIQHGRMYGLGSHARLYEEQSIASSSFASSSQDSTYVQQIDALTAKLEHVRKTQADWESQMQMQQQQMQMQQAQLLDELQKMREQFNKKNADSGAEET